MPLVEALVASKAAPDAENSISLAVASGSSAEAQASYENFLRLMEAKQFDDALAIAAKLEKTAPTPEAKAVSKALRATALLGAGRREAAVKLFSQAEAQAPAVAEILTTEMSSGAWLGDAPLAIDALIG